MRHRALCWLLGVLTAAITGTTLGAAPAIADVTMTPEQVVQGEAAKLTFRVTEDRAPAHTTKIELIMPESAPVAETYPMSNPEWAPRIAMRKVDQALGGIHQGQVSEVVASITWTRAGAPGAGPAELVITLGPVPQTDQMTFALVQTYSDGHVTNWNQPPSDEVPRPDFPAPVLTVLPPAAQPGPDATTAPDAAGAEGPDSAAAPDDDLGGQGLGSMTTGLVIGLLGGLAIAGWLYLRRTRGGDVPADRPAGSPTGPRSAPSAETTAEATAETSTDQEPADLPTGDGASDDHATGDQAAGGGRAWRLRE